MLVQFVEHFTKNCLDEEELYGGGRQVFPTVSETIAEVHHSAETSSIAEEEEEKRPEEHSYQNVKTKKRSRSVDAPRSPEFRGGEPVVELLNKCALKLLSTTAGPTSGKR